MLTVPIVACSQTGKLPLATESDFRLTGKTTRLDYQSFDPQTGRLYIAHLGDDMLTIFDTVTQKVVGDVRDIKRVHGVIAVPELHRIYASATGTNELVVIDDQTLQIVARVPAGDYPDGIAFASKEKKLYVSDLRGKTDTVIDAVTNKSVATIALNAPAGNTQYDAASDRIFVTAHKVNEIIEIDPQNDKVVGRYALTGCEDPHGLLIDGKNRLAFAACEGNSKLVGFDLATKKQFSIYSVGEEPDVLAFDPDYGRLYVSDEKGVIFIFDEQADQKDKANILKLVSSAFFAAHAHTIAVNSKTHRVYFPLENVDGKPVLRIAVPSDKTKEIK